jgi:hypothetical protein
MLTARSALTIASSNASTVRAAAARMSSFTFDQQGSMGEKSGE